MALIRFWLTPFQLPAPALAAMDAAGLQPWPETASESAMPGPDCLLLYDRPDQLIAAASEPAEPGDLAMWLTPQRLLEGYRRLLVWSEQTGQPLLSCSQLLRLGVRGLCDWLAGAAGAVAAEPSQTTPINPLVAATMLRLLDASPELLDAYKDLELRAVLLGREPDLQYRQELQQQSQAADQLLTALAATLRLSQQWPLIQQRLVAEERDRLAVQSAYKHDMASLRDQLERQTAELERLHHEQRAALASHQAELASHQQERDVLLDRLDGQRATLEAELDRVRQDYQQLELRCQHTQDELESFYLAVREKESLLQASARELDKLRHDSLERQRDHQQEIASLQQSLELEQRRNDSLERQRADQQALNAALASKQQEIASLQQSLELERTQWEEDLQLARQSSEQLGDELQKTKEELENSQEELEHYFVQASAGRQLVETQHQELVRAQRLLSRLYPTPVTGSASARAVDVEVMPTLESSDTHPSLQTEALLRAYADNLRRAGILLERMDRH
jgi:hypothetical protein